MDTTKLRWVKSINGGEFTFTPDGRTIMEIAGAYFVFDANDFVTGQYATKAEAIQAVTA
jgi:hypothetical protein